MSGVRTPDLAVVRALGRERAAQALTERAERLRREAELEVAFQGSAAGPASTQERMNP